jgi:hypothetical protein
MSTKRTRRCFFADSAKAAAAAAALGLSLEERVLAQDAPAAGVAPPPAAKPLLPTGKLGKLSVTRLVLGGNLIGGFAHSRELVYVSTLLKRYFTDEKVFETLQLAEQNGINTLNTNPQAAPVVLRYWKERGGKIQWIVQDYSAEYERYDSIKASADRGAHAINIQGNVADRLVQKGKVDLIGKAIAEIKKQGLPAGVAGHSLAVPVECEKAGVGADFYVKTIHTLDYFSSRRPDQGEDVVSNKDDNFWCVDPDAVVAAMAKIDKPWFAYKVMAAGAIPPRKAFKYAFNAGADFVVAGIFDFQMETDCEIAREALANVKRERPWRA